MSCDILDLIEKYCKKSLSTFHKLLVKSKSLKRYDPDIRINHTQSVAKKRKNN